MPEWDAEVAIDEALVRGLLDTQFEALAGAPVHWLAEGWDNSVWLVDERWAFRFPRRAIAVPLLEREAAVLDRIADRLPLPVPRPEFVGRPAADYPWPFVGAPFLPGTELAESALPDEARVGLARSVGEFLRRLHEPDLAAAAHGVVPVDPNRRADMRVRSPRARERLAELERRGLWRANSRVGALLDAAMALRSEPAGDVTLAHGDLHARHLLVDRTGAARGIIDWGDVCIADPGIDLSIAYGAFRGPAREAFWEAYGETAEDRQLRARVLAVFLSATLLLYADDVGLGALAEETRAGLERAVED